MSLNKMQNCETKNKIPEFLGTKCRILKFLQKQIKIREFLRRKCKIQEFLPKMYNSKTSSKTKQKSIISLKNIKFIDFSEKCKILKVLLKNTHFVKFVRHVSKCFQKHFPTFVQIFFPDAFLPLSLYFPDLFGANSSGTFGTFGTFGTRSERSEQWLVTT